MTGTLDRHRLDVGTGDGGLAARRAVSRWAWRMFRREWRQQLLVLALIVVAVAATVVGAAVATNTPPAADAGFGTARAMATFTGSDARIGADVAELRHRFSPVDVIENRTVPIPGSVDTYDIRAQNPSGPYGGPLLALVSGTYPQTRGQADLTEGVARALGLSVGDVWHEGGRARRVVGIVENPESLLDEFALVAPGQVDAPTEVTVLFDAHGADVRALGPNYQTVGSVTPSNVINPETVVIALATLGMLLIALVAVGGFTVLAQRRLRAIGMLGALGATDRNVGLVVRANGLVVGVVGTVVGALVGVIAWLAYRPRLEVSAHHVIGVFALPWAVIVPAMVLAIVATYLAASRPAHTVARVPVVTALSGRPAPPRQVHRSLVPGVVALVASFILISLAGSGSNGGGNGGALKLILGLVALIAGVAVIAPSSLSLAAKAARRAPVSVRIATRDLARYRTRSGPALAAISLALLIAVVVCVAAASRYGNALDYAGPNLASNQLVVQSKAGPPGTGTAATPPDRAGDLRPTSATARSIASSLGAVDTVVLKTAHANLFHVGSGRQFSGTVYVATPQLLRAFGIDAGSLDPTADILSMRPGLDGISHMELLFTRTTTPAQTGRKMQITPTAPGGGPAGGLGGGKGQPPSRIPSTPATGPTCGSSNCVANPRIEEVPALPSGVAAPNTVLTEHAVRSLSLRTVTSGWLVETRHPLTAAEITGARRAAAAAGLQVETKNDQPTSAEVIDWATVFGMVLALGILAMTIGLLRSETASDLRVLTATGASSWTRRSIGAVTAGTLGLAGAAFGVAGGYLGMIAYSARNSLDTLSSLESIPVRNLLVVLIGLPLLAAVVGWLAAGREPRGLDRRPVD